MIISALVGRVMARRFAGGEFILTVVKTAMLLGALLALALIGA
jgi:hypothetical protein